MVSGATWLRGCVAESRVGSHNREATADILGYTRPLNGPLGADLEGAEPVMDLPNLPNLASKNGIPGSWRTAGAWSDKTRMLLG